MNQGPKDKWPRRFHLHIAQSNEREDFPSLLSSVLLEDAKCIVIESGPQPAGRSKKGHMKWRQCVVEIRDALCLTAMNSRLQSNHIICRPRKYRPNGRHDA